MPQFSRNETVSPGASGVPPAAHPQRGPHTGTCGRRLSGRARRHREVMVGGVAHGHAELEDIDYAFWERADPSDRVEAVWQLAQDAMTISSGAHDAASGLQGSAFGIRRPAALRTSSSVGMRSAFMRGRALRKTSTSGFATRMTIASALRSRFSGSVRLRPSSPDSRPAHQQTFFGSVCRRRTPCGGGT